MDLQVHILQHWIVKTDGDRLVPVLSAVDIACCCHAVRPAFLELAGSEVFAWSTDTVSWGEQLRVKDLDCYSKWLQSRQVRVRRLTACDAGLKGLQKGKEKEKGKKGSKPGASLNQLPFIDIVLFSDDNCTEDSMAMSMYMDSMTAVLAACPNITCLSVGQIRRNIEKLPKLQLKTLILPYTTFTNESSLAPFLHAGLEKLVVFKVAFQSGLTLLAKKCPKLQVLELELPKVKEKLIQQLFDGCGELRDFTLKTDDPGVFLETILQAAGQRKRLEKLHLDMPESSDANIEIGFAEFADILERHPWLLSLQVGKMKYSRLDGGSLDLSVNKNTKNTKLADVEALARACSATTKLKFYLGGCSTEMQNVLGKHLEGSLQVLSITHDWWSDAEDCMAAKREDYAPELRFPLPTTCANLTRLELKDFFMTDTWLGLVAKSCKQLQAFHLFPNQCRVQVQFINSVTDAGMAVLFAECRCLREFGVFGVAEITGRTLQSMIDCDLHMQAFIWQAVGFNQDDINRFYEAARKVQFLPVPVFYNRMSGLEF